MGKRNRTAAFPLQRVKKIMQADEDVGKVAQATPVVVCKWNAGVDVESRGLTSSLSFLSPSQIPGVVHAIDTRRHA